MNPRRLAFATCAAASLAALPPPAFAVDGCKVLLCLAGPWRSIPQCVPEVRALFRDLARGRPFPSCAFASGASTAVGTPPERTQAGNEWASADACPQQYLRFADQDGTPIPVCRWTGAISVVVDGQPWSRTWWSLDGADAVTEYAATAKARLGAYVDPTFDNELRRFLETHPDGLAHPDGWQPPSGGGGD